MSHEASCAPYHLCVQDYLQTQFSPAHLLSELGFTIIFDLILVWLVWGKMIKPYLDRRMKQQHEILDAEHHVDHHDHQSVHEDITYAYLGFGKGSLCGLCGSHVTPETEDLHTGWHHGLTLRE